MASMCGESSRARCENAAARPDAEIVAAGPAGAAGATTVAITVATLVALALRLVVLTRPGYLTGVTTYDDGVYFGAAIRLVHGVVPYRDFVLVHPPGIVLLMAPVAAIARLTGADTGMAVARVLTAFAGAASVPLAGLLVRRRGPVAVVVTCGIAAVFTDAVGSAHTVLLEPWLVLFCLIGVVAVFDGDRLTTGMRRLAWGGAALGFAGAVKLWAVFPIVVLLVMCARRPRRLAAYAGGVTAGFLVPVLPFLIMAPAAFLRDVIGAQINRLDDVRTPLDARLASLAGSPSTDPGTIRHAVTEILAVVIVATVAACIATRRPPPPLEWFSLATATLVVASFLWPVDYYSHYAGFFAPFLALVVALPVARLVAAGRPGLGRRMPRLRIDVVVAIAAASVLLVDATGEFRDETSMPGVLDPATVVGLIPPGACVLTDTSSLTISVDRFVSHVPGCPQIVDGIGTDLALTGGRNGVTGAGSDPAVAALWNEAFRAAQYVWLSSDPTNGIQNRRIAWTPALRDYFARNFRPVAGWYYLYVRVTPPEGS